MNRPFPRLVLKVERGGIHKRRITWYQYHTLAEIRDTVRDLLKYNSHCTESSAAVVRITSICVYPDGRAIKITAYTPGEHPWHFAHCTAQQCKFKSLRSLGAAFATLPKEVLDEATR